MIYISPTAVFCDLFFNLYYEVFRSSSDLHLRPLFLQLCLDRFQIIHRQRRVICRDVLKILSVFDSDPKSSYHDFHF